MSHPDPRRDTRLRLRGREADPETTRAAIEETTAETTRAREALSTEETTQASAPVEVSNTLCEGFSTQEMAQDYLDGPRPMPEERPQLDPDGNGVACDGKPRRADEPPAPTPRPTLAPMPTPSPPPDPAASLDASPFADPFEAHIDRYWVPGLRRGRPRLRAPGRHRRRRRSRG